MHLVPLPKVDLEDRDLGEYEEETEHGIANRLVNRAGRGKYKLGVNLYILSTCTNYYTQGYKKPKVEGLEEEKLYERK